LHAPFWLDFCCFRVGCLTCLFTHSIRFGRVILLLFSIWLHCCLSVTDTLAHKNTLIILRSLFWIYLYIFFLLIILSLAAPHWVLNLIIFTLRTEAIIAVRRLLIHWMRSRKTGEKYLRERNVVRRNVT